MTTQIRFRTADSKAAWARKLNSVMSVLSPVPRQLNEVPQTLLEWQRVLNAASVALTAGGYTVARQKFRLGVPKQNWVRKLNLMAAAVYNTLGVVAILSASPTSITANGSSTSTITATVKRLDGTLVGSGVTVSWTKTVGTLSAATSTTNGSGVATITLTSATLTGTSSVTATAHGVGLSTPVVFAPGVGHVTTNVANPTSIVGNGTSTSTLTATVKDANLNLVGAGTVVNWTTDLGTLTGATSVTNASGIATNILTSAASTGTATVAATGPAGAAVNATVTLTA